MLIFQKVRRKLRHFWKRRKSKKDRLLLYELLVLIAVFVLFIQMKYRNRFDDRHRITEINLPDHGQKSNSAAKIPIFEGPKNARQEAVVKAFQHAWAGYKKYAWGQDELRPISKSYSTWIGAGLTLVDALDTAIIMGLDQEVRDGAEWIENSLTFDKDHSTNLFETTIRFLGGLLSSYHLTGNQIFARKAEDLGRRLLKTFTGSKSPIPWSNVNLRSGTTSSVYDEAVMSLAAVGSLQLEFRELSRITGDKRFEKAAFLASQQIHENGCNGGLCLQFIDVHTAQFRDKGLISFGGRSDSFYEYLLKQWIQTGKRLDWLISDYEAAMSSMEEKLLRLSEPSKIPFVGELHPLGKFFFGSFFSTRMDHLTCFLPGTLALGVAHGMPSRHLTIAQGLAEGCHAMYQTKTGLAPEAIYFNMDPKKMDDFSCEPSDSHSPLRPEAIEAWFYMYRLTGNTTYQKWGWEVFQAMEKHAKLDVGYASVRNVKSLPVEHNDLMESFFLAETLKYLYLLFDDARELFPLDQWVFNTEAHPLPIHSS
ncbi:unnamed protein product, partial [Mesorhabditis belari]|uniref:alpha-1,2-Mannosidase n=1 Tax=Mesorhabditis belari TaxID=2138241 RepID=A0AAF3EKM4_9BILA